MHVRGLDMNEAQNRGRMLSLAIAAVILTGDRVTKIAIQRTLSIYDSIPVIPGWLRIVHSENPGAAFGMLADGNPFLRSAVLIGISSAVLIFVAIALWNQTGTFIARFGLSLILGGASGNLYDRVLHRTVTDFIEVYHRGWSFPAFNVADSAITVGAALLLLDIVKPRRATSQVPNHAAQAH
jgi:signal peptidase II